MSKNYQNIRRFRVKLQHSTLEADRVAVEEPLQITLEQGARSAVFSIILRTPADDRQLVYGLLFSEGIIACAADIESLNQQDPVDSFSVNRITVILAQQVKWSLAEKARSYPSYSGCGLCGKTSLQALELKPRRVQKPIQTPLNTHLVCSLRKILANQPLFSSTGGSHVAGLIYQRNGQPAIESSPFFEDVGRHNALDKLIGHELQQNDLSQAGILLLSGRIGFELVQKAVIAGFSVIVALGAPSYLAIQAANQFDIALVGFAKNNCFNLYTSNQHLLE